MLRRMLMVLAMGFATACAQASAIDGRAPLETATSVPVAGSAQAHEMLNRLVGRWTLTGVIAGQSAVHDVEAQWVLQQTYLRISETSRERSESGLPAYEATIYVGWLQDHYVCIWLDNTEVASGDVTCSATPATDAIPFEFRDAQGALIITNTFTYHRAADAWEWRMDNIRDGEAEVFGNVSLQRQ